MESGYHPEISYWFLNREDVIHVYDDKLQIRHNLFVGRQVNWEQCIKCCHGEARRSTQVSRLGKKNRRSEQVLIVGFPFLTLFTLPIGLITGKFHKHIIAYSSHKALLFNKFTLVVYTS